MSHIPQRTEKDCLNCGTIVQGRYCQQCGQENVVPKETFWHMFTHFFYDITHFDSSFFHTVHHLIFKPGFLSKEYMIGRRARYLHPIRMYVFTSAFFFLLFFSVLKPSVNFGDADQAFTPEERAATIKGLEANIKEKPGDSISYKLLVLLKDTSRKAITRRDMLEAQGKETLIQLGSRSYKSREEYDSIQRSLPPEDRDGWFGRLMAKRAIQLNHKYRNNPDEVPKTFYNDLLHKIPYMLFVSLPLFALILKLVYIRRRKQFFYADHGVFTIHLYVFTFLWLLVMFTFGKLHIPWPSVMDGIVVGILFLLLMYYLYRGMYKFYGQNPWKTFLKFLIVVLLSLLMMFILFLAFIVISVFTI